ADHAEHAEHVDVELTDELLVGAVLDAGDEAITCVIDERIEPAALLDGRLYRRVHRSIVLHVERDRHDGQIALGRRTFDGGEPVRTARTGVNYVAVFRQKQGGGRSHAGIGA